MHRRLPIYLGIGMILSAAGCFNMPTSPAGIAPVYVSEQKYADYTCERLLVERDALSRRESQLVIAQEQRIRSSKTQAFWIGTGQGDGIEATELAQVRGEMEAVRKNIEIKRCGATG